MYMYMSLSIYLSIFARPVLLLKEKGGGGQLEGGGLQTGRGGQDNNESTGNGLYWELGLYKILFHFEAFVNESIIILWPPPHQHCPHYCTSTASLLRNIRRHPDPPLIPHAPYNIGNGNIVQRPTSPPSACHCQRRYSVIYNYISFSISTPISIYNLSLSLSRDACISICLSIYLSI